MINQVNDPNTQEYTQPIEKISINRFKTKEGLHTFKIRLISSIILLILLVAYLSTGAIYTYFNTTNLVEIAAYVSMGLSSILIVLSAMEMNKATSFKKWWQNIIIIVLLLIVFYYPITPMLNRFAFYNKISSLNTFAKPWIFSLLLFGVFGVFMTLGILDKKVGMYNAAINFLMSVVLIFAYKAFTITSLSVDNHQTLLSFNTILWVWIMIILGDSFAYIGGMTFGKTKLAPKISPKKTWEGAAIGLSVATVGGTIYALVFYFFAPAFAPISLPMQAWGGTAGDVYPVLTYILLSIIFPIIGLFGDLLYSWIKRTFGIKDFSRLIPGHGGVLDRLDSITFSLAVLFFIVTAFIW